MPPPSHHPYATPAWLIVVNHPLPPDVQTYLDGIAAEHRPMWHRVEGLVRVLHPGAELRITYASLHDIAQLATTLAAPLPG